MLVYDLSLLTEDLYEDAKNLLVAFHESSPYRDQKMNLKKIDNFLTEILSGDSSKVLILLTADQRGVGVIGGSVTECPFSDDRVAVELAWFVLPAFRGRYSLRLKGAFEYWAKEKAKAKIVQMSALEDQLYSKIRKIYERDGYSLVEHSFIKELR